MGRHLGLLVGVNQYQDSTFRPLHFAENDARALAQWLANSKGGKWAPADVQCLQGQEATKEALETRITHLCVNQAEPGDVVLIYFAGQAFVDERSGEGYLALAQTRYADPTSAINLRVFAQYVLSQSRAAQIICILDCFQSGQVWSMQRGSPFDCKPLLGQTILNALPQMSERLLLCSCRGNEFVPEGGESQLGALAHRMIVGLCGPASEPGTGNVTLSGLHAYLLNTLGEQQRPQLFGQAQTPLLLVGELAAFAPQMNAEAGNAVPVSGALLRYATATAPTTPQLSPSAQERSLSGRLQASSMEEQRQQQCQQMLAQAQQFVQGQNYGAAFELVEQVLQMIPNNINALTLKGQLLGMAGRFQEALAVVEQIVQIEPDNALGWSMRAVVLSNMGQYQPALVSIEHSLELDPQNPETYAVKTNITGNMANLVVEQQGSPAIPFGGARREREKVRENPRSFLVGAGLHILGLVLGLAGAGLLIFTLLPYYVAFALLSLSIALLCVNATRGAFRYGFSRLVLTILLGGMLAGAAGAGYLFGYARVVAELKIHPSRLLPIVFGVGWLALAAALPFLLALVGLICGLIVRARRRAQ